MKSPRLLSWPELVWKNSMEMENNRFEREWVSTQRSRVRRLTGRRGYGHHWSGYELVFFLAIFSLSVLWLTLQTRHHTSFTDHDSSIWRLFIRWWFWGSQLSSDSLLRQKAICTIAQLHMSTIISSDHCWWKMQSLSCCWHLQCLFTTMSQVHCHCHRQLLGSLT